MLLISPSGDRPEVIEPTSTGPLRDRAIRPALVGAALAGAWAISALATEIRVDWLLPIVMLLATAGILRAGHALLDRLMFALILMTGTLLALGVVYSVWPWHLDPVGIAGTYLSGVVLIGAFSRRGFQIPRKVRPTDLLLLAVPAYAFYKLYAPIAHLNPIQRFAFNSPIEDEFSHFAYYDAIHSVGGYGFLNSAKTFPIIGHPAEKIYPQGAHFIYVLMDIFTRSTTAGGNGVAEYNRFFVYTMIGFAFLVLMIGWAARWIAGPLLQGWQSALVCTTVVCFAAFGPFGFVFRTSDVAEVVGMTFLAATLAVTMRAPQRTPDQFLITAAAVIGVSFAYYALLVMAAPALLVGLVTYRRRLRRHWRLATAVAAVAGSIAALPLIMVETASFSLQTLSVAPGAKATIDRPLLAVLVLLVLASQFTKNGQRSPTWPMMSATLVISVGVVAVVVAAQGGSLIDTSYYAEKMVYALFLMSLLGFGSLVLLLRPHEEASTESGPRRALGNVLHRAIAPGVAALIAALLTGAAHVGSDPPTSYQPYWLAYWSSGQVRDPDEPVVAALAQRGMLTDGVKTLVITSDNGYYDYRLSMLVGVLNHQEASISLLGAGAYAVGLESIDAAADNAGGTPLPDDIKLVLGKITPQSGEVRVVVTSKNVAAAIAAYVAQHPGLRISVVILPAQDAV